MKAYFITNGAGQRGFTLVEVLIAALIAGIALTAAFNLFIGQSKVHNIQAEITEMQQNGRASIDELVGMIRRAGYQLPEGLPALVAWNANPDTIEIAFLHEPACTASLSDPMPLPSAELKCTDSDLDCFEDDSWAFIWDQAADTGEFFFISHVQKAALHIQHNTNPLSRLYGPGAQILTVDSYKYYIDQSSDTTHPILVRENSGTAEPFADYIEDLQFKFTLADGTQADTVIASRYVREVLIMLIARTGRNDLLLEDEPRRQVYTTRVRVRNL